MKVKAYAKINLTLDVLGSRKDGYHEVNSVMQQVDLHDELNFEKFGDIIVQSQFRDDIILRTILKLKELFSIEEGVNVSVKKNIPIAAGLGGGSSDAAATLIALNELWGLNLSTDDLLKIASELGSDVPFFIIGKGCFVSGRGEILEKINLPEMDILLINPGYEISTKEAYNELDKERYTNEKINELIFPSLVKFSLRSNFINNKKSSLKLKNLKNIKEIASNLHNDFVYIQKDDVKGVIKDLISNGALNASITGKGPTVFGIFDNLERAKKAYENLKDRYKFVYVGKTIG